MRRAWLFEVSKKKPSRGYWKPFLLSRPYEHSQYLPAVVGGDNVPQSKVSPTLTLMHAFNFMLMLKGMRRAWLFENSESPSRGYWKRLSYLISINIWSEFTLREGQSTPG